MELITYIALIVMLSTCSERCPVEGMQVGQEPTNVLENEQLTLICSQPTGAGEATWNFPDNTPALGPGCRTSPSVSHIDSSCDTIGARDYYRLIILSANATRDDGDYTCIAANSMEEQVDIHVVSNISNAEQIPDGATCTSSCGYPATITWYSVDDGSQEPLTTGINVGHENCEGLEKIRSETSNITLDKQYQQIKCCVANRDENDTNTCTSINMTYATTTQVSLSTSDQTPATTANPDTPSPWDATIEDSSKNVTDVEDTMWTFYCTTDCNKPARSIGWHAVKGDYTFEENFTYAFNFTLELSDSENISCPHLSPDHLKTNSTWTINAYDYIAVICCALPVVNTNSCEIIYISRGGMAWWKIMIIVVCCAGAGGGAIAGGYIYKKKKDNNQSETSSEVSSRCSDSCSTHKDHNT